MSDEFKTTFIPKRRLAKSQTIEVRRSSGNSFLWLIAILLFVTTLISSAGVYLYSEGVKSAMKKNLASIRLAEKAFEPNVILELKKLDIRLKAGAELLDNHIALLDFFKSFGDMTLPQISFNEFSFDTVKGGNEEEMRVQMSGEAAGYLPIAQQADLFERNQYIQNPIFSDFELNEETGNVGFSLTFTLNPSLVRYGRTTKNSELKDTNVDEGNVFIRDRQNAVQSGKDIDFNSLNNPQT